MRLKIAILALLIGCIPPKPVQDPITAVYIPPIEDFTSPNQVLCLRPEAPTALALVYDFFLDRELVRHYYPTSEAYRVETLRTEEPSSENDFRRVFYSIKVDRKTEYQGPSTVEIRWHLEKRGFLATEWESTPLPKGYQPVLSTPLVHSLRPYLCSDKVEKTEP